jgi:hypothetical protein
MARIKKNNKDVFQSYVLTTAKYDFSVYEKRIMYRLVEMAQKDVVQPLRENLRKIEPSDCGVNITMPVSDILKDETDKNYEIAKKAFRSLSKKGLEYEDEETWFYTSVIEHPKIDKGTGIATFHVYDPVWKCILNFSKGYKKYELATAMRFKSVYSSAAILYWMAERCCFSLLLPLSMPNTSAQIVCISDMSLRLSFRLFPLWWSVQSATR